MRVISQNGTFDIPYDSCIFQRDRNNIWCINYSIFHYEDGYRIAEYSSEEKALKAMDMLREEYLYYDKGIGTDNWFAFIPPKVFQFPKDEEVEV